MPSPLMPAALNDGAMKSNVRSLIDSACVQALPYFCNSAVVSCGMRFAASASGVSTISSTLLSPQALITLAMAFDFATAIS